VQVVDARNDLLPYAEDLGTRHLARHDAAEEIVFGILHHFVVVTVVADDVDCLDDIWMVERGSAGCTARVRRTATL